MIIAFNPINIKFCALRLCTSVVYFLVVSVLKFCIHGLCLIDANEYCSEVFGI